MAKKAETKVQRKIRQDIEDEFGGFWFKVHGGQYQRAGIPDLLGCLYGFYIGIEVKHGIGKTTKIQRVTLRLIRQAGGLGFTTRSSEHALSRIRKFLISNGTITKDQAIQIAEAGRKVRNARRRGRRLIHGAGDWKDYCFVRSNGKALAKKRRKNSTRRHP